MPTEDFIRTQIQRTRRTVKAVDIAVSLLLLATTGLAFLLTVAVVEHWLVPGGFGHLVRSVLLSILLLFAGYHVWRHLWPYAVQSVNPAYAANAIERHNPSLKNSLLNLLLLGRRREEVPDAVYQTLEQQAAQRLARVPVETAVDRTPLIRVAMAFAAVIIVAAFYKIASPKDPLTTARRVLLPWAEIAAPSRVVVEGIQPGTVTVTVGDVVKISALVRGLADDEQVLVRYTTEDGRAVEQPITMRSSASGLQFECNLPDPQSSVASTGVQRNVRYRIEAGDARSREFLLTVVAAPTITTASVDYVYPEYTGYIDRTIEGMGDIRAIEGTRVTINARSNGPISVAHVDFEADGRRDLTMDHKSRRASASFSLGLRADRRTPEHTGYALRVTDDKGQTNRQPAQYTIEVVPDLVPEVEILQPEEPIRDVKLNETVSIEVEARDPDFALADVRIVGEIAGSKVVDEVLLRENHAGRFTRSWQFKPAKFGLRSGDIVHYWATARDNRAPQANEIASRRQQLRIVSPAPVKPPAEDQIAENQPRDAQPQEQDPQRGQSNDSANGEGGSEQQPSSERGDDRQPGDQPGGEGEQQDQGAAEQKLENRGAGSQGGDQESEEGDQGTGEQSPGQSTSSSKNSDQSSENDSTADDGGESADSDAQRQPGERSGSDGESARGEAATEENPTPVSPDGDHDAEAFERIARHLDNIEPGQAEQNRDAKSQAEENPARPESTDQSHARERREPSAGDRTERDSAANAERSAEGAGDQRDGKTADDQPRDAESQPGNSEAEENKPAERNGEADSPDGQRPRTDGTSQTGDQQQPDQGSPAPGEKSDQQREKWQQDSSADAERSDDGEYPSPGQGKRKTDSAGEKGADDPGDGGYEGSGEEAQRDGTGSAGQNKSADEGAGESSERGSGNASSGAGERQQSERPTGRAGENAGEGTNRREGEGRKPGGGEAEDRDQSDSGQSGEDQTSEDRGQRAEDGGQSTDQPDVRRDSSSGDKPSGTRQEQSSSGESQPDDARGAQRSSDEQLGSTSDGAGGRTGTNAAPASQSSEGEPGGDAANLEYARRQTELVIDKLSDMLKKRQIDQELLDELGWQEEDLRRFVERWHSLKQAAESSHQENSPDKQNWKDALRSLGRLGRNIGGQTNRTEDTLRDLRQGVRVPVPPEFQNRLRLYNQGVSRVRDEAE